MPPTRTDLDFQIAHARQIGDTDALVKALQRAAKLAVQDLETNASRLYLMEAESIAREAGDVVSAARCRFGLAMVTAVELGSHSEAAFAALRGAYTALVSAGDERGQVRAGRRMLVSLLERRDLDLAEQVADTILPLAEAQQDADAILAVWTVKTVVHASREEVAEALSALIKGVALAEYYGHDPVRHNLEMRRAWQGERTAHSFHAELASIESEDLDEGASHNLMLSALLLDEGNVAEARRHALAARDKSLRKRDPISYLMAATALQRLEEEGGDRPAALQALFTAFAALKELLGEETAAPVLWLVEQRKQKWGEQAFEQVVQALRSARS